MRAARFLLVPLLLCGMAACGMPETERRPAPLGIELTALPAAARDALGVRFGVMVTRVGGRARTTRLMPGDIIVSVGDAPVRNPAEFARLVAEKREGAIALLVRRADADLYVTLPAVGRVLQPDELFKVRRSPTGRLLST